MSAPDKYPGSDVSRYASSEETLFKSPGSYSEPFPAHDAGHGDSGHKGIELRQTVRRTDTNNSTTSATYFPGQGRQYILGAYRDLC